MLEKTFPGDSEMAAHMRAFDWASTDMGPVEEWPDNLRTALGICLTTHLPMQVWWGPGLAMLYNDAYIPFLGPAKHPRALGRSAREMWSEIWHQIGPMLEQVTATGIASGSEDMQMFVNRRSTQEEVYVRFSFSPLFAPRGGVGDLAEGVFCACTETTEKVISAGLLDARAEQLAESEERYRSLFASAPMAMFVCDRNAVIQYFNAQAAELWGREPRCGIERHCGSTRLWLPDGTELAHAHSPIVEVLRSGVAAHGVEVSIERPDGSRLPVLVNFAALTNPRGEVTGAITSFIDISARKASEEALRESEWRLRAMIDALPAAIYTTDASGRLTHFNPAAAEAAGRTPELGRDEWCVTWKLFRPDGTPLPHAQCPMAVALHGGAQARGEPLIAERPDGTRRWLAAYPTRLCDAQGRVVGGINMLLDITDRKQAEEARNEADRRKTEFLAMLAHELRNPLAPIRNGLHTLRCAQGDAHAFQSTAAALERQTEHMVRLVDDLLDVSRISRGTIELRRERVELSSLIEQAIETIRPALEHAGQELKVALPPEPVWLNADPVRLVQVFSNLIDNACKYSEPKGRIRLSVERHESEVVATVKDAGIGIPPERLGDIFEMFMQLDASLERSRGGLGIGLALVKRLVELHSGTVQARSAGAGRGSEFELRLPIVAEAETAGAAPPARERERFKARAAVARRILVVDDNRDAATSLAVWLELSGHTVHTVHDGLQALQAAIAAPFDAVLLDIGLPRLSGYEVCRRLRAQPAGKRLVLLAVTGWGDADARRKSRDAGFDAHLVKPVDPAALVQLLAELLPADDAARSATAASAPAVQAAAPG